MKTLLSGNQSGSGINTLPRMSGYRIVEKIYQSPQSSVYRAMQGDSQTPVVIKLLQRANLNAERLAQFRNQYTITQNLPILGIARPLSLETWQDSYALVMEDFGGVSLQQYTASHSLAIAQILEIAIQMADILSDLCQHRVIHKDIKPANIIVEPDSLQIQLIDFSIASVLPKETQNLQHPTGLEGTLAYLSPEQTGRMNRAVDYRTDFYGLGVTLYELFTGQLPFRSNDPMELVHCHIAQPPTPPHDINSALPPLVSAMVLKLMAKNAEDRYQSALGLKRDLMNALSQWNATSNIEDFPLGQQDISDRFLIPEKLYGRQADVQTLLDAFGRISQPLTHTLEATPDRRSEMILVAGSSGIGKTAVIKEVHKPITRQRGYFIQGKFDQFNRSIPLLAFVQALQNLMSQLLCESDQQLFYWRNRIMAAVGDNGQVLIEVIPKLEQIIGPQPPAPELSGNAAQSRFNRLFQQFISVFATADHPLVLFIDDLQWADTASLALIQLLMADPRNHLLLLGAYRDNEVSAAHPFMLAMEALKATGAKVSTLTLSPLSDIEVNQLVADTLQCPVERSQPLSELVMRKTQGNPFFTTQFLKALYDNDVIRFSPSQGHWECNLAEATTMSLTEDIVIFMAKQLQKLPEQTQQQLKLAACMGNQFDLSTLAIVSKQSLRETHTALWKALQEGLIVPHRERYQFHTEASLTTAPDKATEDTVAGNSVYRFLHDRVQQAAYSLIPDTQKQATHYRIGQLLLEEIPATEREDRIFELVHQLNQGIELTRNQAEKDALAELNLIACRKARSAIAYQAMALAFHSLTAELAAFCGDSDSLEASFRTVTAHTHSPIEQVDVYRIKTFTKTTQNQLEEAIAIGLEILADLDITFPSNPTMDDIQQAMGDISTLVGDRSVESLIDLPQMSDPEDQAVMNMVAAVTTPAYLSGSLLHPLLTVLAIKLSLQQGNAEPMVLSYACYGLMACNLQHDIRTGVAYGKLTQALIEKLDSKVFKAAALLVVGMFLTHRQSHIKHSIPILRESYTAAVEVGDLGYIGYAAAIYSFQAFCCAQPLPKLEQEIAAYVEELTKLKQPTTTNWCLIYQQTILNLLEPTESPTVLSGSAFNEPDFLAGRYPGKDLLATHFFCLNKLMLSYLFGDLDTAKAQATEIKGHLPGVLGQIGEATFYFYDSLTALASLPSATSLIQDIRALSGTGQAILSQVENNQAQLIQHWASYAPMNYQHKVDLVAAEQCRVLGQKAAAIEKYEQAITAAHTHGYTQEAAIANELAAKFYLAWGKEKVAAAYLQEAYDSYLSWGALTKVAQLEQTYPQFIRQHQGKAHHREPVPHQQAAYPPLDTVEPDLERSYLISSTRTRTLHGTGHNSTQTAHTAWLDLPAVMKAAQAISQEMGLTQLLATLMRITLANAGAQTGHFILHQDNQWVVMASADSAQSQSLDVPLERYDNLPRSVVYSVARTQETAVFKHLNAEQQFAGDPYVMSHQPQSVLCLPISRQGALVGILYLENNLTTGAFTRDRIEILQLLASQAAISIDNAQLYQQTENYSQTLEAEVARKTQALNQKAEDLEKALKNLQQTQAQLVHTAKMSSLGQIVAGVAHEINNPVNFIKGNLGYTKRAMADLTELVSLYEQKYPEADEDIQEFKDDIEFEFLVEDSTKVLASMTVGSNRISQIVLGLRNFSRLDESGIKTVDLHDGLDSTLLVVNNRLQSQDPQQQPIKIVKFYRELPKVTCEPSQLNQVFLNILSNAIDAIREITDHANPEIRIETTYIPGQPSTDTPSQQVQIAITNNGSPLVPDIQENIFDPFFTTKPVGEGTGLGLFISYSIVQQHQGELSVRSHADGTTEFLISLPIGR